MVSQLLDFFNSFINTVVRGVPEFWQGVICISFFLLALWFLSKCIIKKDSSPKPFKVGYILLAIICLGVCFLYTYF